ncbi:MAG: GH92 family glycosyl hydrolase, partial [Opitutales bacterium]|nr:GH92 family glycosyl hydrolase [Opitutales bacterium]
MKILKAAFFAAAAICAAQSFADKKIDYVNPFIGTAQNGHALVGACAPFGLVQASPDTGNSAWKYCSGYNYDDAKIYRFSQTHLNGTGVADLGDAAIMPFLKGQKTENYRSSFDKNNEKASVAHYSVYLNDAKAFVEATATEHVAIYRIIFDDAQNARLLFDNQHGIISGETVFTYNTLEGAVNFESPRLVTGYRKSKMWVGREVYFAASFSANIKEKTLMPKIRGDEKSSRYALEFDLPESGELVVKIAISTTGIEGAKKNLQAEAENLSFDQAMKNTREKWEKLLSQIEICACKDQKQNFYTALYRNFIQPNNIADIDGAYRGAYGKVAFSPKRAYYSTFSLWDTFRASHPLYTILCPDKVEIFADSMLRHFDAFGKLPIWTLWGKENYCMIANHSIPVLAEANAKGIKIDLKKALNAAVKTSDFGAEYEKLGFFPFEKNRASVARTLECAYDDYCVWLLAKSAGAKNEADRFLARSKFYKNLFDKNSGFMRGKDSGGNWREPFDPFKFPNAGGCGRDYIEGNALQYTWHVNQDPEGLAELFGGNEKAAQALEMLFSAPEEKDGAGFAADATGRIGQYAHGNEPSHHVVYFFSLWGKPHRTQELVREIFDKFYLNKPDGLCGNDDCGQMSAWHVFGALGFYPFDPASAEYVLGAPQIKGAQIKLQNGKT